MSWTPFTVDALPALTALLALTVVVWQHSWRFVRVAITLAHEGSHAVVALICGRSLHGVRVHRDTSGVTVSRGPARGMGAILTFAAGYPGPALLGILAAWVLARGYPTVVLWSVLILLAAMTVQIRNWFGVLAICGTALPVAAISWFCSPSAQSGVAYLIVWMLLFGGTRTVLDLHRGRRRPPGASDADQLAQLTWFPAMAWVVCFASITIAATGVGGWILVSPVV